MTVKKMWSICPDCKREYLTDKKDAHLFLYHNPKINGRKDWIEHSDYGIADD